MPAKSGGSPVSPRAGPDLPAPDREPSVERAEAARETMEELAEDPDVFATFFEQASIGLALADLSGRYVRVNATYAAMLGQEPEDLIGVELREVLHPEDQRADDALERLLRGGHEAHLEREQRYVQPGGRTGWLLHGITVVPGLDGRPAWFAVSAQDVTERRRAEQELRELAAVLSEQVVRDPLTGLANRSLLEERLRGSLARDARTGSGTGLLFLDLDGFKAVNDVHGHAVGDAVLQAVARRLTAAVRPFDTVARLGGDEFVVLVEAAGEDDLTPVVARLTRAFARPLELGTADSAAGAEAGAGRALPGAVAVGAAPASLAIGASIGTAWVGGGESDPAALLRRADAAMYRTKRARSA